MRKVNYLNNKDLLVEIHKSKNNFSYYIDDEYRDYDIILVDKTELTEENIDLAKTRRFNRLKDTNPNMQISDIKKTDLVFRIMTNEHIPPEYIKTRKSKVSPEFKLNFDPYKHYKFNDNDELYEVGRSHWVGGLENGHYSVSHATMTRNLANMLMVLVDRYSQKSNWRGYTWIEDMKSQSLLQLTDVALRFDERRFDKPFAYYTQIALNSLRGVLNDEEEVAEIKNQLMMSEGYDPSFDAQVKNDMGYDD